MTARRRHERREGVVLSGSAFVDTVLNGTSLLAEACGFVMKSESYEAIGFGQTNEEKREPRISRIKTEAWRKERAVQGNLRTGVSITVGINQS